MGSRLAFCRIYHSAAIDYNEEQKARRDPFKTVRAEEKRSDVSKHTPRTNSYKMLRDVAALLLSTNGSVYIFKASIIPAMPKSEDRSGIDRGEDFHNIGDSKTSYF